MLAVRSGLVTYLALLVGAWTAPLGAAELEVVVAGLRSDDGDVHIALYDKPEKFPESEGMLEEVEVPIAGRQARTVFRNLADGRYAVAVYHDENGNDDFDQGFLGVPLEDYGFSNEAIAFFGPPSFEAAAFTVGGATGIRIDLGNTP